MSVFCLNPPGPGALGDSSLDAGMTVLIAGLTEAICTLKGRRCRNNLSPWTQPGGRVTWGWAWLVNGEGLSISPRVRAWAMTQGNNNNVNNNDDAMTVMVSRIVIIRTANM